jgi:tetratricopeptide (TPR) repeat protein
MKWPRLWCGTLALFMVGLGCARAAGDLPRFREIDWALSRQLETKDGPDLVARAKDALGKPPSDANKALERLAIFLRAGHVAEAEQAVRELPRFFPNYYGSDLAAVAGDYWSDSEALGARSEAKWRVIAALLEAYAGQMIASDERLPGILHDGTDVGMVLQLIRHWKKAGRTPQEIEGWLRARGEGPGSFWRKVRFSFRMSHEEPEAMLPSLEAAARRLPVDALSVHEYLTALHLADQRAAEQDRKAGRPHVQAAADLGWLPGQTDMFGAMTAVWLGDYFAVKRGDRTAAVVFYRRAMSVPLTETEVAWFGRNTSHPGWSNDKLRQSFSVSARERLIQTYLALGKRQEAQTLIEEESKAGGPKGWEKINLMEPGMVPQSSGARTIEGASMAAEPESENDPRYWVRRAAHYEGRHEPREQEQALMKALSLMEVKSTSFEIQLGRLEVLREIKNFLGHPSRNRETEFYVLMRKELDAAPPQSWLAAQLALGLIAQRPPLRPDNELYWALLVANADSDLIRNRTGDPPMGHEGNLLYQMIEPTTGEARQRMLTRAEGLCADPKVTAVRLLEFGNAFLRLNERARSLPLLERALTLAQPKDAYDQMHLVRREVAGRLFDIQMASKNFGAAEALCRNEGVGHYFPIAQAVAAAGDRVAAMRLWRELTAADLWFAVGDNAGGTLVEFAALGLRAELHAFYGELANELPTSLAPKEALRILAP